MTVVVARARMASGINSGLASTSGEKGLPLFHNCSQVAASGTTN